MLMVGVTFNEETHFLELHSSDSIWSFRVKILEQFHIVPDQQYLSVRAGAFSREVGITGDVGSWGIRDGSEIIVVMLDQGKEEMDFIHILDTLRKKCVDITMKSDLGSHMVNQFAVHAHEVRQCDFVEEKMGRNGSPKGNIIHKMLEIGSSLKILNLRWQFFSVGDDGAMLIADALERHKSLIEIHIQACGIASRSAKRMGEMLEKNETLRVVDFNENYSMVDEGVISIAKGIETHSSVIHLTLRGCGISSRGALHMGKMLESNTILKRLVLSENYSIDDVGAIAIANALEKNGSLDELHMCNCGISSKGAIRIGEMLEQSTSLRTLLLNGMQFRIRSFQQIFRIYMCVCVCVCVSLLFSLTVCGNEMKPMKENARNPCPE
eukprot:TRINITY_DN1418_c0_g1_i5.p1 TRINITY_DN1418_c0_g1~~TRINITY_DN1418_c0_g1_i5.p1  ORF type:complete len:381 (+),score=78.50 TRINITY_DN1418_c0_g1_i5:357-1499(+)